MIKMTFLYDRKGQASSKKAAPVELRIAEGKDRVYLSTGVMLFPKEWKEGCVIGRRDWKELNDRLQVIKRKCSEIANQMIDEGNLNIKAIPSIFKGQIVQRQTFLEYAEISANRRTRGLKSTTKRRYRVVLDFLERWKGIVYFSDLTEENIYKMDDYLADRGLKVCSRYNYHKILKCFVVMAFNDGIIKSNPYAKVRIKRGDEGGLSRYLTPKEFDRIRTSVMPSESLQKVRDLFVFQTYTMMGYADLADFDYKKCEKVSGQVVYKAQRSKTGQEFMVVLLKPALDILKKYKYKLPIIANANYNLYLKAVAKFAKVDKHLTSHFARHTGATLLLNEGNVPMHIVQHILGHASIRETERTYAKVLDKTIVETMVNYQKRKLL